MLLGGMGEGPLKKLFLKTLLFIFTLVLIEALAFGSLALFRHSLSPLHASRQDRNKILTGAPDDIRSAYAPHFMDNDVLHPYIGFVIGPPTPQDSFGFHNDLSPVQKKSPGKYIVAITGGSVAYFLHQFGLQTLRAELLKIPALSGKQIMFIRIAAGGFKQPQQLMALNYLLDLGAEFDLVINVDGFNEAALPVPDNVSRGISPVYPRLWFQRIASYSFPKMRLAMDLGTFTQQARIAGARFFSKAVLSQSAFFTLVWEVLDRLFQGFIKNDIRYLQNYSVQSSDVEAAGPRLPFSGEPQIYDFIAGVWARSSLLMSQICAANHILYFHFLQPNQYFPGSKTLSEEEKQIAFKKDHPYRSGVVMGYPAFQQKAKTMLSAVHYFDLTGLFAQEKGPIYIDDCCHYNEKGNILLGRAIGEIIRQNFPKATNAG